VEIDEIGLIASEIERTARLMQDVVANISLVSEIQKAAAARIMAIRIGNDVLFAGNGSSAANAQHLAAELVGIRGYDRPAYHPFR
jgi:D-sedoheptulose 7-phosphate isomerase